MNIKFKPLVLFLSLTLFLQPIFANKKKIEASGITRADDILIIVGDEDGGNYQKYPVGNLISDKVIKIKKRSAFTKLLDFDFDYDLEGVVYINDNVFVVSERLRALLTENQVVANYSKPFAGYGNKGVEGLAIKKTEDTDRLKAAALWEGGYPEIDDLPLGVNTMNVLDALPPVILLHSIVFESGQIKKVKKDDISAVPLDLSIAHKWIDNKYPKRNYEPWAYRFRAPDLIWQDDELIVLMSASSEFGNDKYSSKVLQKFNQNGIPTSKVFLLDNELEKIEAGLSNKNWEGMAWFDESKQQILLVCDEKKGAVIVLLNLPASW